MLSGLMVLLPRRTDWWYQATVAAVVGVREGPGTVMCEQLGLSVYRCVAAGYSQRPQRENGVTVHMSSLIPHAPSL